MIARNPKCQHLFLRRNLTTPSQFSGRRFIVIRFFTKVFVEANQAPQCRKPLPGHGAGAHRHRFGGTVCWEVTGCEGQDHTSILFCCSLEVSLPDFIQEIRHIKVFFLNRASAANGFFFLLLASLGVGASSFIGTECRDTMMPCLLPVVNHPPGHHYSTGRQAAVAVLRSFLCYGMGEVWSNNQTSSPSDFRIPNHYFI